MTGGRGRKNGATRRPARARGALLLAYYGDDFTGSADVMEALARAGVRTALFLKPPSAERLRRYPGIRAFGIAGTSRTMSPAEMTVHLPRMFRALKASGARVVHYKMCSTCDSSPRVGSVGKAIELGQDVFGSPMVPLLVGAPMLGRYCVFGNLFARSGLDSEPHRLDRHPTMRHHPITPIDESDLRLFLARQTRRPIGLLDVSQLGAPDAAQRFEQLRAGGAEIVLLDVLNDGHLPTLGELIWREALSRGGRFVVGSSCVEYALTAHWRQTGELRGPVPAFRLMPTPAIAVVSGSCSPVTDRQIRRAVAAGFAEIALDTESMARPEGVAPSLERALEEGAPHFTEGRSVIFHTARGPEDPRVARTSRRLRGRGVMTAERLGGALGTLMEAVLERTGWRRGVVTGGDTSGYAARAMGIEALEYAAPAAPGSPLCRVHAPGRVVDGREMVFKGGQNGRDDFLVSVLLGEPGVAREDVRAAGPLNGVPRRPL